MQASDEAMFEGEIADQARSLPREEAFRRLADHHLVRSYRLARAILGSDSEAEDATHDAFITAWRNWRALRDPGRFEHWFDRILVNTCRNRLRRASRFRVREIEPSIVAAEDGAEARANRDAVGSALAALDPDHRIVVALRYYVDLTVNEIADRLGVPAGTVKSRLHYALRRLHDALDDDDAREALK